MEIQSLLENLKARGIRLSTNGQRVVVEPASRLTDQDREAIRAAKPELLRALSDPMEILARLKGYVLPAGRMETARIIVQQLEPLLKVPELDQGECCHMLRAIESDLVKSGAVFEPDLAAAVQTVSDFFPGAKLVN
jgi:hypothetical protein